VRNDYYTQLLLKEARVFPDVLDTLQTLHTQVRMGIVTSSRRDHFNSLHKKISLTEYFDFVLTREDFEHSKPHPDAYRKALKLSRAKPKDVLVVEDSPRGLQSAQAAGLDCAVIVRPHLVDVDFSAAQYQLHDLRELKKILGLDT